MPWVPFAESELASAWEFVNNAGEGEVVLSDSRVSAAADVIYPSWLFNTYDTPALLRITVEAYESEGFAGEDARFQYLDGDDTIDVVNSAADRLTGFEPSPFEANVTGGQVFYLPSSYGEGASQEAYTMLLEVWEGGPGPDPDPDPADGCCGEGHEPADPGYAPIPDPVDPDPPVEPAPDGSLPNCDCHDETQGRRTLRQLRDAILAGLGFVDTLGRGPQKTLCQMRCSVLGALNLGSAQQPVPRTLAQIRTELTRMSGYSANVPLPPGYSEMVTAFINQAQQALWQRLEMSRGGGSAPVWLVGESDPTTMDGALVQMMALALLKAHYGKPDAAAYRDYVEATIKGHAERMTPVSNAQVDNALRRARYTVWNRAEPLPAMEAEEDLSGIHFLPIELLAIAELKARLGHKDAGDYRRDYERYVGDNERRSPAGAGQVVTGLIQSAQAVLGQRYTALHTERFYSWPLTAGVRLYDIPDNAEECPRTLDPRKVTWVGVEKDGQWYPLYCGIPPELYTLDQHSFPQRYEIRSCIEVWPTPDETSGRLIVKGGFAMAPFTEDYHRPTIDDELIYLHALAAAKAQYKQPDAKDYAQQAEVMLTRLVAAGHQTKRYLPGARVRTLEPDPVWTDGSWP